MDPDGAARGGHRFCTRTVINHCSSHRSLWSRHRASQPATVVRTSFHALHAASAAVPGGLRPPQRTPGPGAASVSPGCSEVPESPFSRTFGLDMAVFAPVAPGGRTRRGKRARTGYPGMNPHRTRERSPAPFPRGPVPVIARLPTALARRHVERRAEGGQATERPAAITQGLPPCCSEDTPTMDGQSQATRR